MKIQTMLPSISESTFLESYLEKCGIKNPYDFLKADLSCCDDPFEYPNMQKGIDRLKQAIEEDERIGILIDPDFDGIAASTIIYQFISMVNSLQIISLIFHNGKIHGIAKNEEEDILQTVINNHIDLLICPDSGSNDIVQHQILFNDYHIDCLVLDHHEIKTQETPAIIINPHLNSKLNKNLSGAGVTFKFCQACAKEWNIDLKDKFYDLVATSIVTDICDMRSTENYALVKYGFAHITNPMLKALFEQFNTKGNNPIGVSWGCGPKVNAVARSGNVCNMQQLFYSFIGEQNIGESLSICSASHYQQSKKVNEITKSIKNNIDQKHSINVGFIDNKDKSYSGLIANKFSGKYSKPTLILRKLDDGYYSGSLRSPIDIADKINDTDLATCTGHLQACGIVLMQENLDKLLDFFDAKGLELQPPKTVCSQLKIKNITLKLCNLIKGNMLLWSGSEAGGIPTPKFYITFESKPNKIKIFSRKTNTIKFKFDKCEIIKFQAKQEDVDKLYAPCKIEAIIELSVNEWNGKTVPQGNIIEWEVTNKVSNKNWNELF